MKEEYILNPKIFKAYDIRGFYPSELNSQAASQIGTGLAKFLAGEKRGEESLKIALAQDNRPSSPALSEALKKAMVSRGADVIDIGLSTTPMFYFAVWQYQLDGGIIVTASHNPPEYNGFKIVREQATPVGIHNGLEEIKRLSLEGAKQGDKKGRVEKKEVIDDYLDFVFSQTHFEKIKPLNIAIDTANAVPGLVIEKIKEKLPGSCYHIFSELDGDFPNHLPNPLEEKNILELEKIVLEKNLDLGVAFDGDGDRIIFVDEKGKMVPSDFIISLMAKNILKEKPGAKIVYNVCSSNIIRDVVKENGGVPLIGKIGHTFIKDQMKKEGADFAGEFSGHYFFGKPYFFESPFFVFFKILEEISTSGETISELIKPFNKYFNSGQINIEVADKEKVLNLLEEKFKKGEVSRLDGLRIDFPDWWFSARPSNTEDLLRVVVEADSEETMKDQLEEIKKVLN
jgi:phosphomannomutase